MKRVCIITSIIHGFGKQGGFGVMARQLARSLAKQGFEVVVAVPRRNGQKKETKMEGYTVLGLGLLEMVRPKTYRKIGADLYHSQSPNLMSAAAMRGMPRAKHVITCRDPRNMEDWRIEIKDATWKRKLKNLLLMHFEEGRLVKKAVQRADAVGYAAKYLQGKIKKMYEPKVKLTYLPNIEPIPKKPPRKSKTPKVCFIGRLDKRKRPELFIDLARKFPKTSFVMVGKAEDREWHEKLLKKAKKSKNLKMLGYVDKFTEEKKFYESFQDAWVFVNTASREAFPLTFFEAGGRGCAILSHVNPDNAASRFGYWAKNDDFEKGLRWLLEKDRWKTKGRQAHQFFKKRTNKALEKHLELYRRLLG